MAEILTPYDYKGKMLSPFEARTGVVLPIWGPPGDGKTNRHHPHFFKRNWINGPRKIETRAVRFSRLDRINANAHTKFHKDVEGTLFPRDQQQSFEVTLLNCVRYIPSHVIDLSGPDFAIAETTPRIKKALLGPGRITMERRKSCRREIGQFLMYHAVSRNFDHAKRARIEEFIELGQPRYRSDELAQEQRCRLGMRLANIGLGLAVDGIDKLYQEARNTKSLSASAPVCAWQVAKDFVEGFEHDYFDTLEQNLVAQYG